MSFKCNSLLIVLALSSSILALLGYAQSPTATSSNAVSQSVLNDILLQKNIHTSLSTNEQQVNVRVIDGTVYLSGALYTDEDYENIIFQVMTFPGVNDVNVDALTAVSNAKVLADLYITAKVKSTLLKANFFGQSIPLWPIQIQTVDGQVYLSGTIHSAAERDAVLNLVNSIPGIAGVQDEIFTDNEP
jgi:hyperosmotically inducible protein